jgi:hypothetical protein
LTRKVVGVFVFQRPLQQTTILLNINTVKKAAYENGVLAEDITKPMSSL